MRWCPGRSPRQGDGRPPWLLESHFGEASELARMQPFPLQRLELFQRLQPDIQMLAHALPVELARHAGELDLTVKRLVGDRLEERRVGKECVSTGRSWRPP